MTGILKVDQIQNNTGTSALTINSSGMEFTIQVIHGRQEQM